MSYSRYLVLVAAIGLPSATMAAAKRELPAYMAAGTEMEPPRGFLEMCAHNAQWCVNPPATPGSGDRRSLGADVMIATAVPVPVDGVVRFDMVDREAAESSASDAAERPQEQDLLLLRRVNHFVNGRVRQRHDREVYGVGELWRRSGVGTGAVGDCEDIAIEKRLELIAAGFPADRLAFAIVYRRDIGLHTVLVARTERADMVLDSLTPYLLKWTDAGYSWISFQSMQDAGRWFAPATS